ncbi:MAG: type I pullulanase, partial [Bacillota bacterium]|nr:type I pullulanase [Bacillota bacterium]
YTFSVTNGIYENEVMDPYAKAAGVNGDRGMVIDFDSINPNDWESDVRPATITNYTDAIIYEIHVRDYTTHATWNGTEALRGKYLGLVEGGTTYQTVTTGFDHIKELGVTHVQLLPVFDHGVIDETRLNDATYNDIHDGIFNWGYMPENFNVIEGSYSTDPYNGDVRITEFKEMVQTFHENDIRVIMDVVYNHTGKSADSNFDLILPGYYFRMNPDGSFSNGSGTGNETASERIMYRKFMVDSILFYVNEYHIDGFRFDLMKLHDVETMNQIVDAVHAVDPTILIYGEPWTGGTSTLPLDDAAFNSTLDEMPGVAVFNDDTRDGIKGSVFAQGDKGFVQGNNYADSRVLLGITGATQQANLPIGALPKGPWAFNPTQTINYVTAHDNNTLYDKLKLSAFVTEPEIVRMQRQANAIVLTSQGIPFLHGGVEILRTKPCTPGGDTCDSGNRYDHNSYKSPDATNQIDWNLKVENLDTFNYYKSLIALRKMKSVFRIPTKTELAEHITIIPDSTLGFVSFFLSDPDDVWKTIYILHNNGDSEKAITLQ